MPTVRTTIAFDAVDDSELIRKFSQDQKERRGSLVVREALEQYYGLQNTNLDDIMEILLKIVQKLALIERRISNKTILETVRSEANFDSTDHKLDENISKSLGKFRK